MKLIPEQLYNRLMLTGNLDQEKIGVLNGLHPDEVKVMLYQQASRNSAANEKKIANTPLLVKNVVDEVQAAETVAPPSIVSSPAVVLENIRAKGATGIFIFLRKLNILPNTNDEITIDGKFLAGSNYPELLKQLAGNSKLRRTGGVANVISVMQKYEIPKHLFSKQVYQQLFPVQENSTPKKPLRYKRDHKKS